MTGPPFPRYVKGTGPGANSIGSFVIGVSPVGDVPPFDFWPTVLSQYANSPILTQLCSNMAQYVDQTANMDLFYDSVFNVLTATGPGLDIWGAIVGVNRVVQLPSAADYLGFQEAGSWQSFGQQAFYSGGGATNNYALSDESYRLLILAKALANITDGSIPSINQLLLNLFPGLGNCYIADGLNMTMTYTFDFVLSPVNLAIVANSGVLPRSTGVAVIIASGLPR